MLNSIASKSCVYTCKHLRFWRVLLCVYPKPTVAGKCTMEKDIKIQQAVGPVTDLVNNIKISPFKSVNRGAQLLVVAVTSWTAFSWAIGEAVDAAHRTTFFVNEVAEMARGDKAEEVDLTELPALPAAESAEEPTTKPTDAE